MSQRTSTTCKRCNRVLWVEDGPICDDCKAKEPEKAAEVSISRDELLEAIDEQKFPKKDAGERKGDH